MLEHCPQTQIQREQEAIGCKDTVTGQQVLGKGTHSVVTTVQSRSLEFAERVDLKGFHHKKGMIIMQHDRGVS